MADTDRSTPTGTNNNNKGEVVTSMANSSSDSPIQATYPPVTGSDSSASDLANSSANGPCSAEDEVFRSMKISQDTKTPYSDATQVSFSTECDVAFVGIVMCMFRSLEARCSCFATNCNCVRTHYTEKSWWR